MSNTAAARLALDAAPSRTVPESECLWLESEGQVSIFWGHLVCALTFWLALPLLYALWRYVRVHAHTYSLTDQVLRESRGVLAQRTQMLELYRVQDISVEMPLLYRLFGRGRVVLHTSDTTTPIVTLNAIRLPGDVATLLRRLVENCRVAKGVRVVV